MSGPRLPGVGAHHAANPQTDEWLTPPEILRALGRFDLDPCAPHDLPRWTRCARHYTATDDGLSAPWEGSVFCNPPYSNVEPWMRRMAAHGNGVALVFARTETRWWFDHVWPHASALLFLAGRVSFLRIESDDDESICPSLRIPADQCDYCDGGDCNACDMAMAPRPCEHTTDERHEGLDPIPTGARNGGSSGGPSVLVAYGGAAANRLAGCDLPGAYVRRASISGAQARPASRA